MTHWHRAAAAAMICGSLALSAAAQTLGLRVLSSPPTYVSGGDARIEVTAPVSQHGSLWLRLNGAPLALPLEADGDRLQGVVTGLKPGSNLLEALIDGQPGQRARLLMNNHPVTGPMFSGPQQTPFVCRTNQGAVNRQPLVDRATPPGYRVTDAEGQTVGYSTSAISAYQGLPTWVAVAGTMVALGATTTLRPAGAVLLPAMVRSSRAPISTGSVTANPSAAPRSDAGP